MLKHRTWRVTTLALALGAPLLSLAVGLGVNAVFDDKAGALIIIAAAGGALGLAVMVAAHLRQYFVPQPREELAAVKRIEKRLRDSVIERATATVEIELDLVAPESGGVQRRVPQRVFVSQVTGRGRAVVLVGPEGSGKSAIATRVALTLVSDRMRRRSSPVPLLLSLATWDSSSTLRRWVVEEGHSRYAIPKMMTSRWINTGRIMLILDGLEGLPPVEIASAAKQLNVLAESRRCGVMVTADPGSIHCLDVFRRQTEAVIQPISNEAFWDAVAEYYPVLLRKNQKKNAVSLRENLVDPEERLALLGMLSPLAVASPEIPPLIAFGDGILRDEGDLRSAKRAYSAVLNGGRYRGPALARLALVASLEGDHAEATELFGEALGAHLAASVSASRNSMSDDDLAFLRSLHVGVRYDAPRAAAAARLGLDQAAEKLLRLTNEGWLASERGNRGLVHFLATTPPRVFA